MSAKKVVDEIELLIKEYAPDFITFEDDLFVLDRKRVFQICNEMNERKIDVAWGCEGRVNIVDYEMLKAMKEAGCRRVAYGVESGSQRVLDKLNKRATVEQARRATHLTKKAGMDVIHHIIVGTPGETKEDIKLTEKLLLKEATPDNISLSIFMPLPGTKASEMLKDRLLIDDADKFADYYGKCMFKHEYFSPEQIEEIRVELIKKWREQKLLSLIKSPRKFLSAITHPRRSIKFWKALLNY